MTAREPWFDALRSLTDMDVIDWGERVHEVADALPVLLDIAEAARDLQRICGRAGIGAAAASTPEKYRLDAALARASHSQSVPRP